VIGAAAGYLSLWLVYWTFKLTTGKEGMGYGDFKLLAALGAWLGWQMLPLTIPALVTARCRGRHHPDRGAKRGRSVPIPFGPYLAAAGGLALFWGKPLTRALRRPAVASRLPYLKPGEVGEAQRVNPRSGSRIIDFFSQCFPKVSHADLCISLRFVWFRERSSAKTERPGVRGLSAVWSG
jgi:hypothetical protein